MGAGDCNVKRSSIICRKGPFESVHREQPPRFPCITQNKKSRKKRQANSASQEGKMVINAGDGKSRVKFNVHRFKIRIF